MSQTWFTKTTTTIKDQDGRSSLCATFDALETRIQTALDGVSEDNVSTEDTLTADKILVGAGTNVAAVSEKTIAEVMSDAAAYTVAEDAHWADPNPTTIAEALDRIAAAVYALQTDTPIA